MKLAEKNELIRRSDQELARNKSLTTGLYEYEAKSRATAEALHNTTRQLDDIRFTNS